MTSPAGKPWRFTHLTLENWRNFTRAEADLSRRVFLVGPNASGKSNFLDALRFLHDVASVGGGFQEAVSRRGGVSRIRSLAVRRCPEVFLRVVLGDEDDPAWQYELAFTQDNQRTPILRRERVTRAGKVLLDRPDAQDRDDPRRLTQTYLEQVNANKPFRAVADFFRDVRYLHVVPQLVREPDRSVGRHNDPFGGDFLEQIARSPEKTRAARLRRIQAALRVAVPQLLEIRLERDLRGAPHLRGRYRHGRPHGAWQNEEQFSDGTLRLMGLLWALLDGTGPLLLEEPELSLHPHVVRFLPQMLARLQGRTRRQAIISTHSSEMLLDEGIGLHEVLLLEPGEEGTGVRPAASVAQVRELLDQGLSMAEAVLPRTQPENVRQLSLFGD